MKDPIQISGRVVRGAGYGQALGFPTANLEQAAYERLMKKPREGIYAGRAELVEENEKYLAAIVIGPKDQNGVPKVEAHLLDYDGSLYGRELALTLTLYLRPFKKFGSEAELKTQIRADVAQAREIGNKISRPPQAR